MSKTFHTQAESVAVSYENRSERVVFLTLSFLFLVLLVGGGASRFDVASLLFVRPITAATLVVLLFACGSQGLRTVPMPSSLMILFVGLALIQLVPLPPSMWLGLPGRDLVADMFAHLDLDPPWMPLSLTPARTIQSILFMLIPLAVLIGMPALDGTGRSKLLPLLLAGVLASAVLGIVQISTGASGWAYLYRVTDENAAVGFFANKNHQSALLAATFPMLRVWTLMPAQSSQAARFRLWAAAAAALFLLPMIVVTGSRAGLLLGAVGIAAAVAIKPPNVPPQQRKAAFIGGGLLLLLLVALIFVMVYLGRAVALDRAMGQHLSLEGRFTLLPLLMEIMAFYQPFGSGMGSFEAVFKLHEPDALLTPYYWNRAHNDYIELALTGGIPAVVIAACFAVWLVRSSIQVYRPRSHGTLAIYLGRLGASIAAILLLSSLVDYPLRTPLLAFVFACACVWLGLGARATRRQPGRQ